MKVKILSSLVILLTVTAYACLPDTKSARVVLNNGEYSDFKKIELYGDNGKHYLKDTLKNAGVQNAGLQKVAMVAPVLSATLLSVSFNYDPDA
ncbi:MAG: hypothetical protein GX640_06435, partial [Fibrobacter sp.]|nr:hypothetical protein [Fibrobacter sp.]